MERPPWAELALIWSPTGLLLLGLCVGSFVNVVARRLPLMLSRQWWAQSAELMRHGEGLGTLVGGAPETHEEFQQRQALSLSLQDRLARLPRLSLMRPASHCAHCAHALRWHENLPLLGWMLLRGRCSACGVAFGVRYPLVELACGAVFVAMGWRWGQQPVALLWSAWAAVLVAASLIDWDTLLLPDVLTLPLLWVGLTVAALGWTIPLSQAVWGAAFGYAGLWLVAWAFEQVTGREAMGGGDFKLLAALGAWLGPLMLIPLVFGASLCGALVGLWLKQRSQLRQQRYVPFAPFLALSAVALCLMGSAGASAWLGF